MKKIPSIILPIINGIEFNDINLFDLLQNKKVVIFGVPGAFTPTCSKQHLPGFLDLADAIKEKGIDDIYCMSVNDKYVMQSWFGNFNINNKIKGIADGNSELSELLNVKSDKSANFMGFRCERFAMIVNDNLILKTFFEEKGNFKNTSAENILKEI